MSDLPHPVELSDRVIDSGVAEPPHNRVIDALTEVEDDVAIVESFSHCWALRTDEGLVCVDSSGTGTGADVVAALRGWSTDPVHTLVYTHGHLDHVGGSGAFVADAADRKHRRPTFVSHEAVPVRFDRYRLTDGWNRIINRRQFGGIRPNIGVGTQRMGVGGLGALFMPDDVAQPDITYRESLDLEVGGRRLELRHARGETDDHTWIWEAERRTVYAGDFVCWVFPNAGNPQKVQRYPVEWAAALREMLDVGADRVYPAHGLPIVGRRRVETVLGEMAEALEHLADATLAMMNDGARLDEILHTVTVPDHLVGRPWIEPLYDEPEFVVRNLYRLWGGWWDGDPARLKPAADAAVAAEVVGLAGSVEALLDRAEELAEEGDLRLACHMVEMAVQAAPDHEGAHRTRARVYWMRRAAERSLMSKGIFAAAARESEATYGEETPRDRMRDVLRRSMG